MGKDILFLRAYLAAIFPYRPPIFFMLGEDIEGPNMKKMEKENKHIPYFH